MNDPSAHSPDREAAFREEVSRLPGPILITGVSGFIGANLFRVLSAERNDIYGCSRNPGKSWRLANLPRDRFFAVDITREERLRAFISDLKPRTVYNLSAYGAYARQDDATKIHDTNYMGTLNLIRALLEVGCEAFVQAGTSSEYGLNCLQPKETGELIPNSDYAVAKAGASYLVKYYGRALQFPAVNLRFYSVYGPWEERDRLIPTLVSNCLGGRLPSFAHKDISRDFLYIGDCLSALVKAPLTACITHKGASLNIATGVRTTLEDVAGTAKKLFNITEKPVFGSMANRKWDLAEWYGDPRLAGEVMKWKAAVEFEQGLLLTAEWEKEYSEQLKYVKIPAKAPKISVVVACYKDELSIPVLYERLSDMFSRIGTGYELIFVNDCSPYKDEERIWELAKQDYHVIGISHSRNFGSQSAFMSGMEMASGDAVVLMDGDGQDPPEIIEAFYQRWQEGYEVVYGDRVKREGPLMMQWFYKLFYRIFRKIADFQIPADAGDFSLIDRKALNYLLKLPEKDIFIRGLRAWIGFRQTGVPYLRPERLFGKSTNNFFRNILWAKKAIFSFSMKPLHYIQAIGVAVFFITLILILFYAVMYFIDPASSPRGIATIILLVLGLGAIQLISISVLGDYISKITEEVKNRPRFIRKKLFVNKEVIENEEDIRKVISGLSSHQSE